MTGLSRFAVIGALALALPACGSSDATGEITRGADGAPSGDTGWQMTEEGDSVRLQRQLNNLTLSYALAPGIEGMQATVRASARPCLSGDGRAQSEDEFTPLDDDASAISDIRVRFEDVIQSVADQCDVSQEAQDEIASGFDGLYFRSASQRAAISGS